MPKKKKELQSVQQNTLYSLDISNEYGWNDQQKLFLCLYIQTGSFKYSCSISKLNEEDATTFLMSYNAQKELRRINMMIANKQFENKMASLNDIGGYLTSLIIGDCFMKDKLETKDKIAVIDLLLKVHKTQIDAIKEPQTIIARDLNVDFKNLSIQSLKTLIDNYKTQESNDIINSSLSPEEIASIKSTGREIAEIVNTLDDKNE